MRVKQLHFFPNAFPLMDMSRYSFFEWDKRCHERKRSCEREEGSKGSEERLLTRMWPFARVKGAELGLLAEGEEGEKSILSHILVESNLYRQSRVFPAYYILAFL